MRKTAITALGAGLLAIGATRSAPAVAEGGGVRAFRLSAIKADIARHLAGCELTVGAVAASQGVSPRYVQLLFGQEGTTFSRFVLAQRLLQAHRMLADALYARWSITAIAFEAGFGDLSYFNRSFRRRYAVSPSDVRKAARREHLPVSRPANSLRMEVPHVPTSSREKPHGGRATLPGRSWSELGLARVEKQQTQPETGNHDDRRGWS